MGTACEFAHDYDARQDAREVLAQALAPAYAQAQTQAQAQAHAQTQAQALAAQMCESNVAKLEHESLCSMSFVPSIAQINQLCVQSIVAEVARAAGKRGPLLSKLHALPGEHGCCPDSLNPDDTILCKLGRGDIGPGGSIGDKQVLTVIDDRNMPLGGGSCGPNGVATACGGDRINLFYRDIPQTRGLLDAYLALRSANEDAIFDYYVKKLVSSQGNYTMDPGKDETLNPAYHKDYDHVCVLMTLVRLHGFRKCGFSVNSFCQTWLRNGSAVGNAEFSVMSPHFQNRFFVHDATQLSRVPGINDALMTSYARLIQKFTQDMQKDYGVGGGGQAFVNLDGLQTQLGQEKFGAEPAPGARAEEATLSDPLHCKVEAEVGVSQDTCPLTPEHTQGSGSSGDCITPTTHVTPAIPATPITVTTAQPSNEHIAVAQSVATLPTIVAAVAEADLMTTPQGLDLEEGIAKTISDEE